MIYQVDDEQYAIIKPWWAQRKNWLPIPREYLPGTGYVYYNKKNHPIMAGFLYIPRDVLCKVAWFTWLISNPDSTQEARFEGLKVLEAHVCEVAKEFGIDILFTDSPHQRLTNSLNQLGYVSTDENITHLVKPLLR